jgi:uncharacterized Zn finger protein
MIHKNELVCPKCGGKLKYYDAVKRIIRTKNRITRHIKLRRFQCGSCGALHRELPNFLFPYKQYEVEVIRGVIDGYITPDTLGYEDYPSEITMKRWIEDNDI